MNIAYLTGISRSAGGLYYAVGSLCRSLMQEEVRITVLGRQDRYAEEDRHAWGTASVITYKGLGPAGFSSALRGHLASTEFALIHQHGLWMDDQYAALQWQKKRGRPVVISPHGMLDPWAVRNSAWKKKLVGALFANESLQKASCIHALCQSEADSIRAYGLKNPIAIIPNGVELPEIGDQKTEVREQKTLLFLGRIHPKKGLKELIQAWAKAQSLKPEALSDWQLIIAGWDDGGYESGLKELAGQLSAGESIDFIGPKFGEDKERLLRSVDAFILPSFSEGLPMSVLEAWAYRLPVVMTEFCNIPEGFTAEAALKIAPDAESIAHGLLQLAAMEPVDLTSMGQHGRLLVEQKFTWEKIAQDMKTVYEHCIAGRAASL